MKNVCLLVSTKGFDYQTAYLELSENNAKSLISLEGKCTRFQKFDFKTNTLYECFLTNSKMFIYCELTDLEENESNLFTLNYFLQESNFDLRLNPFN